MRYRTIQLAADMTATTIKMLKECQFVLREWRRYVAAVFPEMYIQCCSIHSHRPACREQGQQDPWHRDCDKTNGPVERRGDEVDDAYNEPKQEPEPAGALGSGDQDRRCGQGRGLGCNACCHSGGIGQVGCHGGMCALAWLQSMVQNGRCASLRLR